jgi:hypothetical protein
MSTLLVISSMTLFLFLELNKLLKLDEHLIILDKLYKVIAKLDIENISKGLLDINY